MSDFDEPILADDYPMHGGYMYVVDGQPRANEWMCVMTVREYRQRENVSEVRRCDIYARIAAQDAQKAHDALFDGDRLGDAARISPAAPSRSKSKKRSFRIRKFI